MWLGDISLPWMESERGPIVIGNDVWISYGATILSGVTIGNGAVIGAKAVVTKNVDAYSIVAGNPATHIRYRFDRETINFLEGIAWWEWDIDMLRKNARRLLDNPGAMMSAGAQA